MEDQASALPDHPPFWALQYLTLRDDAAIEEGRRATAINFCTTAEAGLPKGWEDNLVKIYNFLKHGPAVNNVSPLTKNKPNLSIVSPDDQTG